MFTYFTDRDGKMQLAALAQSGFDPLSRSCRFMLTEEAHHLFVGETGVGRTIEATCNAMKAAGITDPYDKAAIRRLGVVDLPTLQKKANFHMSVTRDLFGSEISSNGAEAFSSGLKGRFNESGLKDDHQLENATYPVLRVVGELARERVPTRLTVTAEFLGGVEEAFVRAEADVMVSVLPPKTVSLRSQAMAPLRALLVARKGHPLVAKGAAVSDDDLRGQVLLVVRGSDPRLRLSTDALDVPTVVSLNDFHAKRTSLLDGLGYGWMPEHLIEKELRRGALVRVRWKAGSTHTYQPHVYTRAGQAPGRAAQRVIDALVAPRGRG